MFCRHNAIVAASLAIVLGAAMPASAYDDSWYKTDFWAGEYPEGFTIKQDVTTKIRKEPDHKTAREIECSLKKGETYHQWNEARVKSSKLEFVSLVKKVVYIIKEPASLALIDEESEKDTKINFDNGDEWTYLTYYAEGAFRMEFKGVVYTAEQSLFEVSGEKGAVGPNSIHETSEWMKLTCANGKTGWLLYEEVFKLPQLEKPEFPEYGVAIDKAQ